MRSFDDLLFIAAERKGSFGAVLEHGNEPLGSDALSAIPDDRWLSQMTRCIFQAGFNWKVIDNKWDGFEAALQGFDVPKCAMMDDVWFDALMSDTRVVRNAMKLRTIQENAVFISERSQSHESFGNFIAKWPDEDFAGLLLHLKTHGSRLGGTSAQYFLRTMGKDSYILGRDGVARLIAEGIIDKPPTSKRALYAVQEAFNTWRAQSGHSFNTISRVLAQTLG